MSDTPRTDVESKCGQGVRGRCYVSVNFSMQLERELQEANKRIKRLEARGDRLEELLGDPPKANCSCHISPPCSDCVDWAAIREAKDDWNQAKEINP